ncbi:MAG: FHIPEP family type III secretion protein [Vulcanimicrobiota bacterium]
MKKDSPGLRAILELNENRTIRNAYLIEDPDTLSQAAKRALDSGEYSVCSLNLRSAPAPGRLKEYLSERLTISDDSHDWVLVHLRVDDHDEGDGELEVKKVLTQLGQRFRHNPDKPAEPANWINRLDKVLENEITRIVEGLDKSLNGDQVTAELRYGFGWALGRWMAEWYLNRFEGVEPDSAAGGETQERVNPNALYLSLGSGLSGLLTPPQDPPLLGQLHELREHVYEQLGFSLPDISIHIDSQLGPRDFYLRYRELMLTHGRVPEDFLILAPGEETIPEGKDWDPELGGYRWVDDAALGSIDTTGLQVLPAAQVVKMHLGVTLQEEAWRLLSIKMVNLLLDHLDREDASVTFELERENVPVSAVRGVLRELLRERCSIADLTGILEAILEGFPGSGSLAELVARVRQLLGRSLYAHLLDGEGRLEVAELSVETEDHLLTLKSRRGLRDSCEQLADQLEQEQLDVLLVNSVLRADLWQALHSRLPHLTVLAYDELEPGEAVLTCLEL